MLNNIFLLKMLKNITFYIKLIEDRKRPKKKNIEALNLTRKVNLFRV